MPGAGASATRTLRPSARNLSAAAFAARWPTALPSLSAQISTMFTEFGRTSLLNPLADKAPQPGRPQACITLTPEGQSTKLVVTEYGDFLDGYDDAGSREHGTNFLMGALGKSLE